MKKKTVSIMVAATMALSLFAGCGSSKVYSDRRYKQDREHRNNG